MKPAPFDYYRAEGVDHALELLGKLGDDAKVLAGGQSLVPLMNFRLARPSALVDVNRLRDMDYIREEGSHLRIGALTRHATVEASPTVAARCPLLAEGIKQIGHAVIRGRGTVGGSIAHADPAAELPLMLVALGGRVTVRSQVGGRSLSADEFFVDALTTALGPAEMVVEVSFDTSSHWTGSSFLELARRQGDFALAAAAVLIQHADGVCQDARIALGGAGPVPFRAQEAEASLRGQRMEGAQLAEAARLAAAATDPPSDVHGSSDYRRQLAQVLVDRALHRALGLDHRQRRAA